MDKIFKSLTTESVGEGIGRRNFPCTTSGMYELVKLV